MGESVNDRLPMRGRSNRQHAMQLSCPRCPGACEFRRTGHARFLTTAMNSEQPVRPLCGNQPGPFAVVISALPHSGNSWTYCISRVDIASTGTGESHGPVQKFPYVAYISGTTTRSRTIRTDSKSAELLPRSPAERWPGSSVSMSTGEVPETSMTAPHVSRCSTSL